MKKRIIVVCALVAAIGVAVLSWVLIASRADADAAGTEDVAVEEEVDVEDEKSAEAGENESEEEPEEEPEEEEEEEEPLTEEEKREAEEDRLAEEFDDLTDKWQDESKKGISMADIDNFAKTFKKVPKDRQDDGIHRALNLIPDENVLLLAGVLMDKSNDKDIIEAVFNDILNRDEDVKAPILKMIHQDPDHPCWDDADWVLTATGDTPEGAETTAE